MKKLIAIGLISFFSLGLWAGGSAEGTISAADAKSKLAADKATVLIDVRTQGEFQGGHIPEAVLLPYDQITKDSAAAKIASLDTPMIVYCRSGHRSGIAAKSLRALGYTKVFDLGSINNWTYGLAK